ncbi:MAG: hypothetical protein AAF548_10125 [Actinomycetota bacterium]
MDDDGDMDDGDLPDSPNVAVYCDLSGQSNAASDAIDFGTATPEELEAYFRSTVALMTQGLAVAEPAIAPSLEAARDAFVEAVDVLEVAGWDFFAAADELELVFDVPEAEEIDAALETYDEEVCGFDRDGDPDEPGDELAGDPTSAYCLLALALFEEDAEPDVSSPESTEAFYGDLIETFAELDAVAPLEILPDLEAMQENFSTVYAILEQYGFDIDAAGADLDAFTAEVDDEMDAAISNLEEYEAAVCGIEF